MNRQDVKEAVRQRYGAIAREGSTCCGPTPRCPHPDQIGYGAEDLARAPEGSLLGLGCGNPLGLEEVRPGEVVLDLGSGPGLDCFLAAERVGPRGRVIGVDMTPDMIERAQSNARQGGFDNVEFRLGDIEDLPVPDASVDLVISNCVINLSPDKARVLREAFRVLRPGGRLVVADIVLEGELPEPLRGSVEAYTGCAGGALERGEYLAALRSAGFESVEILRETGYFGPARSITVRARKPLSPGNRSPDRSDVRGAQEGR